MSQSCCLWIIASHCQGGISHHCCPSPPWIPFSLKWVRPVHAVAPEPLCLTVSVKWIKSCCPWITVSHCQGEMSQSCCPWITLSHCQGEMSQSCCPWITVLLSGGTKSCCPLIAVSYCQGEIVMLPLNHCVSLSGWNNHVAHESLCVTVRVK